jgi:signal transduction histidine kinase
MIANAGMYQQIQDTEQQIQQCATDYERIVLLYKLATLFFSSDLSRAISTLAAALELARTLGEQDMVADINTELGRCYYTLDKPVEARAYFTSARQWYEQIEAPQRSIGALMGLASCELALGNNVGAIDIYTIVREYCEQYEEKTQLGICLNGLGIAYKNLGYPDKALAALLQAMTIPEVKEVPRFYTSILNAIGNLYSYLDDYTQALSYYTEALQFLEKNEDVASTRGTLLNVSSAHRAAGNHAQALATALHVLQLCTEEALNHRIHCLSLIGGLYMDAEDYDTALQYEQQALDLALRNNETRPLLTVYLYMGEMYEKKHQYEAALQALFQALALVESTDTVQLRYSVHELIAKTFESMGNYREALHHYRLFATQRHEVQGKARQKVMAEMQALFDVEKARKEAEFHKKNNEEISRANRALEEKNLELSRTNKKLVDLNNEKNDFLSLVAHDLKNPLGQILGLSQLLRDDRSLQPEEIVEFSNDIMSSSERMFELITNLLDINAIEQGKIRISLSDFDLDDLLRRIVQSYAQKAQLKNITIHFRESETPVLVHADPALTMQVLDNLLSNALKYSPHNKRVWLWVQTPQISDQATASPNVVQIVVQDEGPGFTDEDRKRLFGKFARLSAQPTGGEHSTGLGLSIVKKLVEAMNGHVSCASEAGKGAAFTVELPVA